MTKFEEMALLILCIIGVFLILFLIVRSCNELLDYTEHVEEHMFRKRQREAMDKKIKSGDFQVIKNEDEKKDDKQK